MPAPVMTTTFRDFHNELAISCSRDSESDSTWVVGIVKRLSQAAKIPRETRSAKRDEMVGEEPPTLSLSAQVSEISDC